MSEQPKEHNATQVPIPWGRLQTGERWPHPALGRPVSAAGLRSAGLFPWAFDYPNGPNGSNGPNGTGEPMGWATGKLLEFLRAAGFAAAPDQVRARPLASGDLAFPNLESSGQGLWRVSAVDLAHLERVLFHYVGPQAWRNERYALRKPDGELYYGNHAEALALERSLFRPLGLLSVSVQLNVYRADGLIWIAQRALHKAIDPGLWDAAVAGGLPVQESPWQAIVREAFEEAGIGHSWTDRITYCGDLRVCRLLPDCLHHEQVKVFRLQVSDVFEPVPVDGEVQQFACVSISQIETLLQQGQFNYEAGCATLAFV